MGWTKRQAENQEDHEAMAEKLDEIDEFVRAIEKDARFIHEVLSHGSDAEEAIRERLDDILANASLFRIVRDEIAETLGKEAA